MMLTQDPRAWREGLEAGVAGDVLACPYRALTRESWSWHSGWIEGAAVRNREET